MIKKRYENEREGQIDFFNDFGIDYTNNNVLIDNTDGVWNGNLLEFKLEISNLNKVLFQAIKYLSYMRIKGESVPANILLVSLNETTVYQYKSEDYFKEIHEVYSGAASKDNDSFIGKPYLKKYNYMDKTNMGDVVELQNLLKSKDYMPIEIDENCIVGWAERYYREVKNATKGDFIGDESGQIKIIGEIREPKHFNGLIIPYTGKTNEKFKYLMDKLNDRLKRKDLGAFYTPIPYCEKAAELVREAIKRVPIGNDYIILDRCAGTGNLESVLFDEELSHCILSTYEYYEYKVLVERLGGKVRAIIPPKESMVDYANGCVRNADALSKEYLDNTYLRTFIDNPECTIILYENPPYRDQSSGMVNGKTIRAGKNKSFVVEEMKKEVKGVATNELTNQFVWSGFKYYLRQPTDSYVLFSPIKYWKQYNLANKHFERGFVFNRNHFHATPSAITCSLWYNEEDYNCKSLKMSILDIGKDNNIIYIKDIIINKVNQTASKFYSDVKFSDSDESKIYCAKDGTEANDKKICVKSYRTDDVIGYLEADGFSIAPHVRNLTIACLYNGHGCYLTKNNHIETLPIWVAKHIPLDNWYETDIYATTSDGGDTYTKDRDFLKYCLIYTCLSNQNKCLSFKGSDGRIYQNELCFDTGALALNDLQSMTLNDDETVLINLWKKILEEAKQTNNYSPQWRYGVYQIIKELNTYTEIGTGKQKSKIYDYPELNGDLDTLRVKLKEYYKNYITPLMFKYELVK